jgi:uncharacterized protein (TIGR02996 family)
MPDPSPARPTSDDEAFRNAVLAAPDDDAPRLVYADWLEERGDPRGEFIRLDLELARRGADDPAPRDLTDRRRQLLAAHAADWLAKLPAFSGVQYIEAAGAGFDRGFPTAVETTWGALREVGDALFAAVPVTRVRIRTPQGRGVDEAGVFDRPWFRRVRGLSVIDHSRAVNGVAARLAASPNAASLRDLRFDCWSGLDHTLGVRALADSPHLAGLERLALSGHDIGTEEAELIAGSRWLVNLRTYRSAGVQMAAASVVGQRGATAFATAPVVRLRELWLPGHSVGPEGTVALAGGAATAGLRVLDLSGNGLRAAGARALAGATLFTDLRDLRLGDNRLGDAGVEALAGSPVVRRLRRLDLTGEPVTDHVALALVLSPYLRDDCEIRLGGQGERNAAAADLVRERFPNASWSDGRDDQAVA